MSILYFGLKKVRKVQWEREDASGDGVINFAVKVGLCDYEGPCRKTEKLRKNFVNIQNSVSYFVFFVFYLF